MKQKENNPSMSIEEIQCKVIDEHRIDCDMAIEMRENFLHSKLGSRSELNKEFLLSQECKKFIKTRAKSEKLILEITEINSELDFIVSFDEKEDEKFLLFNTPLPIKLSLTEYREYMQKFENNLGLFLDKYIVELTEGLKEINTRKIFVPLDIFKYYFDEKITMLPATVILNENEYSEYFEQITCVINVTNNLFDTEEWFDRNGLCPPGC